MEMLAIGVTAVMVLFVVVCAVRDRRRGKARLVWLDQTRPARFHGAVVDAPTDLERAAC